MADENVGSPEGGAKIGERVVERGDDPLGEHGPRAVVGIHQALQIGGGAFRRGKVGAEVRPGQPLALDFFAVEGAGADGDGVAASFQPEGEGESGVEVAERAPGRKCDPHALILSGAPRA